MAWITNTEHLHKPQSNLQHVIQLQRLFRKLQPTGRCCIKRHGGKIQVSNWFSFNTHTAKEDYFHSRVSNWDCFPWNMYSLRSATEQLSVQGILCNTLQGGMANKYIRLCKISITGLHLESSPQDTKYCSQSGWLQVDATSTMSQGSNVNVWVCFSTPWWPYVVRRWRSSKRHGKGCDYFLQIHQEGRIWGEERIM